MSDEPTYVLSSDNQWVHIFRLPKAFWRTYCGARADWEIHKLKDADQMDADRVCPYCLVLKGMEDAEQASTI